jgi:predicted phage tail protein
MSKLTKITFHGNLAEALEQKSFEVNVESVSEGLRAVDILSKRKLSKAIIENEKQNVKYKILADEKSLFSEDVNDPEKIKNSEMFIEKNYNTIDVVPVLEGAGGDVKDIGLVVGGAVLIGMGISPIVTIIGAYAVLTGMANILSEPPEYEDFREIQQVNKKESYLFNGPINTYNPGGPVPIGYGRIMVGSLAIAYSHEHGDRKIYENGEYYN